MNWQGLLKWSIEQHSNNTDISKIKAMSEEDKQWVRDMMEEYEVDIVKEMNESIKYIRELNQDDPDYEDKLLSELEVELDMIQGIENANIFARCGGIELMFELIKMKNCKPKILHAACLLFSECSKNNHFVQERALKSSPFEIFNLILENDVNDKISENEKIKLEKSLLNCLSSMVRGLFLRIKRLFIEVQGIEFIQERLVLALKSKNLKRIKQVSLKVLPLLEDLILYDSQLGGPEDLLMTEQDKIIKSKKEKGEKAEISMSLGNNNGQVESNEENQAQLVLKPESLIPEEMPNKKFENITREILCNQEAIEGLLELLKIEELGYKVFERVLELLFVLVNWDLKCKDGKYLETVQPVVEEFVLKIPSLFDEEEDRVKIGLLSERVLKTCS